MQQGVDDEYELEEGEVYDGRALSVCRLCRLSFALRQGRRSFWYLKSSWLPYVRRAHETAIRVDEYI